MPGSEDYPFRQEWAAHLDYFPTPQSFDIYSRLLKEWAARFATGQQKYRDVEHLGAKGVFPDVNRKTGRLRSDVWEERTPPPDAEPTRVVILDLIGHLFLMLHLWDNEPLHGLEEREETTGVSLHAAAQAPEASNIKPGQTFSLVQPSPSTVCPNPHAHDDGWEDLPYEAQQVLRAVAAGDRVLNIDREAVKKLVEKHDAQEPS